MLYKDILLIPFVLSTLNSVHSATQSIYASNNTYLCTGASDDRCDIYCDVETPDETINISCGNAGECYLYCDEKQCISGTVNATFANNLYVKVNGRQCMKESTVLTPSNGNATFTMTTTSKFAFWGMDINAGDNTQNIIVNCDADISNPANDCTKMNINAETANYFQLNVANELKFGSSKIQCPVNSNYKGPNEAPCIIDASNSGSISDVNIITKQGYPIDVSIRDDGATIDQLVVTCDEGEDTWGSDTNVCWNTNNPTYDSTANPTVNPTVHPTENPFTNPSDNPTVLPTINPSMKPTANPTTFEPTLSPTKTPTKHPIAPQPTLQANSHTPSPTYHEQIVIEDVSTTLYNEVTSAQRRESQDKMSDAEMVVLTICAFVCGLVLCVVLCYCYRSGKYYKEALKDKQQSLMESDAGDQNKVQMHIFENNPYNNLMATNVVQNVQKFTASWNSDDACIVDSSPLVYGMNTMQKHGESISLSEGNRMNAKDMHIVQEINQVHTKGEDVGFLDEGIKKNELNVLTTDAERNDRAVLDDIDNNFRMQSSKKDTLKGNDNDEKDKGNSFSCDDNDPANDPEVIDDESSKETDEVMTQGLVE